MKLLASLVLLAAATQPAVAQVHDHSGHGGQQQPSVPMPAPVQPTERQAPGDHAADAIFGAQAMEPARRALAAETGAMKVLLLSVDMLEARIADGRNGYYWDATASYGGDIDRIELKSEGEGSFGQPVSVETQLLWSRAIAPQFDLHAGLRHDAAPGPDRTHGVLGISGLAPYNIDVEAVAFLSHKGEISARFKAAHDIRVTQRLIAQPLVELQLSGDDVPELGIADGLSSLRAGMRLRYEIAPEFAPYAGVEWLKDFGGTARYTRAAGDNPDRLLFVAGVSFWF